MARVPKVFETSVAPADLEPVPFDVAGWHRSDPSKRWTERFTARAEAPVGVILDVGAGERVNPKTGQTVFSLAALSQFFDAVLVNESIPRFRALIHDDDRVVSIDDLGAVFNWLIEEYTDRPTTPQSTSPGGSAGTGGSSVAASSPAPVLPPPPV